MNHQSVSERLAGDGACSVYRCGCGCLHVQIGSTTVRMSAETLSELAAVLGEARRRVPIPEGVAKAGTIPC
jgi:hypothetical protein